MIQTSTRVVEAPAYEPVSLAQAKRWLRMEHTTASDAVIRGLITAFRERAENLTLRSFVPRTLRYTMSGWPLHPQYGHQIVLPYPPLVSVSSLKYRDTDGALQTLAADQYDVYSDREPGVILPAYQVTWPTIRGVPDAVQVTYVAGYSPESPDDETGYQDAVPESLKTWMQVNIGSLHENREAVVAGTILSEMPRPFCDGLLDHLVIGQRLF